MSQDKPVVGARTAKVTGEDMDKVLLLMTVSILGKMRPDLFCSCRMESKASSNIFFFLLPATNRVRPQFLLLQHGPLLNHV